MVLEIKAEPQRRASEVELEFHRTEAEPEERRSLLDPKGWRDEVQAE